MVQSYVSIDLETTGLNPRTDRIIEIGAVKVINGISQGTFSMLVDPGRRLEPRIAELTGICDTMLAGAPGLDEVLPGLFDFMGELPLLGHRVLFDYSFLKKAAVDRRLSFDKEGIDTLKLARCCLPQLEHKSLEYLCAYYEIPHQAHRAPEDAMAAHKLYQRLVSEFYREENSLFRPQRLTCQIKRDTPVTPKQKERLYRLLERHRITVDVCVDKLTRSEADRLTDRILARYGR